MKVKKTLPRKADFSADAEFKFVAATEEGGLPTFSIRAYNGGALAHPKFPYPVVVDLATLNASKSRPALLDHQTNQRVGHTTDIQNHGTHLDIDGVVSASNEVAREVVSASQNGFPWQASIGVYFSRPLELVKAGRTVMLNGKTFEGPVLVARGAILREITFTALGVDDDTSAQIAASLDSEGDLDMDPKFAEWLTASHFNAEDLSEEQLKSLEASWKAITAKPLAEKTEAPKTEEADGLKAAADLREYTVGITTLCAKYDNPEIEVEGKKVDLAAHAIRNEWSSDKTELVALRNSKESLPLPAAHFKQTNENASQKLEASLLLQETGNDTEFVSKYYDDKTLDAAMSKHYRSTSIQYLLHQAILASGGSIPPGTRGDALIDCYKQTCLHAAGPSTISVPGILSNVANKSALQSFLAVPTTWRQFCATRSMNDFKKHTSYRLTAAGTFLEVGKDGEIKSAEVTEASFENQLATYGRRFALTRQDVINDDLNMLSGIRALLGRQAALSLEEAVFTLLLANTGNFFHADNNNLVTTAALATAGLAKAEQAFMDQTDADGKPIVLGPASMLVPTSLSATANRLFKSELLNETTTADTPSPSSNIYNGKYGPIVSPYLNNSAYTGYSATSWYLFGSPRDINAMEVGFLNGNQTPTVESAEAEFAVLGFQLRGYFDFGVAFGDPLGAVKCTA